MTAGYVFHHHDTHRTQFDHYDGISETHEQRAVRIAAAVAEASRYDFSESMRVGGEIAELIGGPLLAHTDPSSIIATSNRVAADSQRYSQSVHPYVMAV